MFGLSDGFGKVNVLPFTLRVNLNTDSMNFGTSAGVSLCLNTRMTAHFVRDLNLETVLTSLLRHIPWIPHQVAIGGWFLYDSKHTPSVKCPVNTVSAVQSISLQEIRCNHRPLRHEFLLCLYLLLQLPFLLLLCSV